MNNESSSALRLSIIIPVYNGEKYIAPCLDSLLEQDVSPASYEVIVINDGSTDGTLAILQQYADRFPSVRLVDKPNGGVSVARNLGLELARGEYVWLVDADDWVARDCFGVFFDAMDAHHPSAFRVQFDYIKAQWRVDACQHIRLDRSKVSAEVRPAESLPDSGAWSSIFRRDILERYQHRFIVDLHYGEDVLFVRELFDRMRMEAEAGVCAHTVVHCQGDIFYYYRQHETSAMNLSWTKNRKKYMAALIDMAKLDRARMEDETKPAWYREMYRERFFNRMHTYMMHWLPDGCDDLAAVLKQLRADGLYPCPKPPKQLVRQWTEAGGLAGKAKAMYRYLAFRWAWLYPLYHGQMTRKYQEEKNP